MSVTTIMIRGRQIDAVRASLRARRDDLQREPSASSVGLAELDALLQQVDSSADGAPCTLTAERGALWTIAYDVLCGLGERLASDCNELWRGTVDTDGIRVELDELGDWIDVLDAIGCPPAARD